MEKLSQVFGQFISNNQTELMKQWETERDTYSIWHSGPIDNELVESVNNIVQSILQGDNDLKDVDLIVDSQGGYIEPAYQVIRLLDRTFKDVKLNFIVPRMAKSAATLLACGCDKILFSQVGEIGPLDVQIGRHNQAPISGITIKRLVDEELKGEKTNDNVKEWIYRTLKPEEVLEMRRFNDVAVKYLKELLPKRMFKGEDNATDKIDNAIEKLCDHFPNHSFVIDCETATKDLEFNAEYVSQKEELLLQNTRELWDYQRRLQKAIGLNSQNQILKRIIRDLRGRSV